MKVEQVEKALKKIAQFIEKEHEVAYWCDCLERLQLISRANRIFRRISGAPDIEQLYDSLAEVRYALIFAGLGFEVEVEPKGDKGPDLGISREGQTAVVEVRRFRPVHTIPVISFDEDLPIIPEYEYENLEKDLKNLFTKISEKFSQVGGDDAIVALWNDDDGYDEIQVRCVIDRLRIEAGQGLIGALPVGLSCVLFRAKWITSQEIFYFSLQMPKNPRLASWIKEIEDFSAHELVQRALDQQSTENQ